MQKYRNKNFFQFLWASKPLALFVINFFFFGGFFFSMLYFVNDKDLLYSLSITFLALFATYIITYIPEFVLYKKGKELYKVVSKPESILLKNLKTYIPNYNPSDIIGFQDKSIIVKNNGFKFTLFFFDRSDILISGNSLFLFGYGNRFLTKSFAVPIEIERNGFKRYMNSSRLLSYDITKEKIYLEIKYPIFKKPIKIEVEYRKELEMWLTTNKQNSADRTQG